MTTLESILKKLHVQQALLEHWLRWTSTLSLQPSADTNSSQLMPGQTFRKTSACGSRMLV